MVGQDIFIIGYSGHAYICIETTLACWYRLSGYYDKFEKKGIL